MATTIEELYGTVNSITITLASLGNAVARSSLAVSNLVPQLMEIAVQIQIKTGAGVATTGTVNVYAYGSIDGSLFPEGCGTDVVASLTTPTNLRLLTVLNANNSGTVYVSNPLPVSLIWNGWIAQYWGICVYNNTGASLDGTPANHIAKYQGLNLQGV
jgi:hypothetical protein